METKSIRTLTADDIDLRIGQVFKADGKDKAVSLLLYKNARVDMNIMDEVFGPMNWQRCHEFKDGKLYCTVSVYDPEKQQWIDKEDVGTESNTEAEKGQASDSFKRACVNWGIGRELYTAPFIYIELQDKETPKNVKFFVKEIIYHHGEIVKLIIVDKSNIQRFQFQKAIKVTAADKEIAKQYLINNDNAREWYCTKYQVGDIDKLKLDEVFVHLKTNGKI